MSKLQVTVNPQVELLMVVLLTSNYSTLCKPFLGYSIMTEENTEYVKAIKSYFKHFSNHKIYRILDEMIPKGFALGAPVDIVLSLGSPPSLEKKRDYSSFAVERACGKEKVDVFVELLRDFADKSDFLSFFNENESTYANALQIFNQGVNRNQYIEILENFYGREQDSYDIYLTQLSKGSFGFSSKNGSGRLSLYNVCGFMNNLLKGKSDLEEFLDNILWHEFSHPIINPLTDEYENTIKAPEKIYKKLKTNNHSWPDYSSLIWKECVNEHVIRAICIFLCRKYISEPIANKRLDFDIKLGYTLIPSLLEAIAYYDKNRNLYRCFEDLFMELLDIFNLQEPSYSEYLA